MECPECKSLRTRVHETAKSGIHYASNAGVRYLQRWANERVPDGTGYVVRTRSCDACTFRFRTLETYHETVRLCDT